MSTTIGDGNTPIYEFMFYDENNRTTDEIDASGIGDKTTAVEVLAKIGREDPDADVTLIGFE